MHSPAIFDILGHLGFQDLGPKPSGIFTASDALSDAPWLARSHAVSNPSGPSGRGLAMVGLRTWQAMLPVKQGLISVLIEHHPTIGISIYIYVIISKNYWKVM